MHLRSGVDETRKRDLEPFFRFRLCPARDRRLLQQKNPQYQPSASAAYPSRKGYRSGIWFAHQLRRHRQFKNEILISGAACLTL
jgi:hypothetical protein